MFADAGQIHKAIDRPQQVISRNVLLERKLVKQRLLDSTFPHHATLPLAPTDQSERMARPIRKGFGYLAFSSLHQRIRPRSVLPAKMEIRTVRSS